MDEHQKGIQMGLRAAATFLESEAEDIAERLAGKVGVMTAADLAKWLGDLAKQVRELQVTRGR